MKIMSSAFENNGMIPSKYTCDGSDVSPPLSWSDAPPGTKSFALICDDPDAPMGTWVHWLIFNIPPNEQALPENVPALATLPNGAKQGTNSWNKIGYGGPCPPSGVHRYFFKLYALATMLSLDNSAKKTDVITAMTGHVLEEAQLIEKYSRRR